MSIVLTILLIVVGIGIIIYFPYFVGLYIFYVDNGHVHIDDFQDSFACWWFGILVLMIIFAAVFICINLFAWLYPIVSKLVEGV